MPKHPAPSLKKFLNTSEGTRKKKEVEPFLKNSRQKDELNLWSDAFFNDYLIQEIGVQTSH